MGESLFPNHQFVFAPTFPLGVDVPACCASPACPGTVSGYRSVFVLTQYAGLTLVR